MKKSVGAQGLTTAMMRRYGAMSGFTLLQGDKTNIRALGDHMGYTLSIHKRHYQTPQMGVEMGRVSGFLEKIDSTIVVYESVDADIFDKQISEKFHQVRGNEKCNKIIESVDYDTSFQQQSPNRCSID